MAEVKEAAKRRVVPLRGQHRCTALLRVGRLLVIVVLAAVWDVVVRGSWDQATRMELAHICFDEADLDGGLDGALLGDRGGLVHLDAHALRPLAHGGV
jgi:hypothetical protein